ncbi:MAG: antirestriction protein [Planctomycetales bacterium 71-10]|nr:MAG: antirestriction protein [Planctomycetales bacterium 71-10]
MTPPRGPNAGREDLYSRVTNQILADLEKGVRPWTKPWDAEHAAGRIARPLRSNGQPYRGVNVLLLWSSAVANGFAAPLWMTFNQAKELGGRVKAGSKGTPVVYADRITKTEAKEDGGEEEKEVFFMKQYTVFNAEQVAGLPGRFYAPAAPRLDPVDRIERAEAFCRATGADVRHGGNSAYYAQGDDRVQMPPFEAFRDAEGYYATLLHELAHWTKHEARLDRDLGRRRFGDEGYAREELVAEIGASFLCADLDLEPVVREDHAAYVAHWLKVLADDKRAIFVAAALAEKAAGHLHALQPRGPDA